MKRITEELTEYSHAAFSNLSCDMNVEESGSFDLTMVDPDSTALNTDFIRDNWIDLIILGQYLMTGVIRKVEYSDTDKTLRIQGEGLLSLARDKQFPDSYVQTDLNDIISKILTDMGWLPTWFTSTWGANYSVNSGNYLDVLRKCMQVQGWPYWVDAVRMEATVATVSGNTVTIDPDSITPYNFNTSDCTLAFIKKATSSTTVAITGTISNGFTTSGNITGVASGDTVTCLGKPYLYAIIPTTIRKTVSLTNNDTCLNYKKGEDKEKVVNVLRAHGTYEGTTDYILTYADHTLKIALTSASESTLGENLTAADTTITLAPGTDAYPASGTILIDSEKISYTGVATRTLTGCTRGANSTTAVAHRFGSDVIGLTEVYFDWATGTTPLIPAAGSAWIGTEQISYTGISYVGANRGRLTGITRGVNSTTKYRHFAGTTIQDAATSQTSPATDSSIGLYGVRPMDTACPGLMDRQTIDKYVANACIAKSRNYTRATTQNADINPWLNFSMKDQVEITTETATKTYSIAGWGYSLGKLFELELGYTDNYMVQDIADVPSIAMQGLETNQDVAKMDRACQIVTIDTGSKMVYVCYLDDGTYEWVRYG